MFELNPALIQLWISWFFLFVIISGIGLFVYAFFAPPCLTRRELLLSFWVGLAASTFFLQIWHLFFPVNPAASAILLAAGVLGLVRYRHEVGRVAKALPRYWAVAVVMLGLGLWVASRAANAEVFIDDTSYHIPDLLWTTSYAIVPGLGNLHGRLAFNNAYTLPLAAIDVTPLPTVIRLGNGLVILAFLGQALIGLQRLAVGRSFTPQDALLSLAIIPVLSRLNFASSIKNDLIVSLLSVLLGVLLLDTVLQMPPRGRVRALHLFIATLLCCFGITIKLSFGVYGLLALAVMLVLVLRQEPERASQRRLLALVGVVFAGFLGVWVLRGVILSGYPAYPLTLGALPVPWRVPEALARLEADIIYAWARDDYKPVGEVLTNWNWLPQWFENFRRNTVDVVLPALLSVAGLAVFAWLALTRIRRASAPLWPPVLFGLTALAGILFWFVTAPDLRFGWQYFWLLGGGLFVLALWDAQRMAVARVVAISLVVLFGFDMLLQSNGKYGQLRFIPFRQDGQFEAVEAVEAIHRYTSYHGVDMLVPEHGHCVATELPCAFRDQPFLKMRVPGDLGAGFVYEEAEPDKGAFALRDVNPADDIGPDWASEALHRGELPESGLLVGNGWHALEQAGDEQYRWVDNDAEIFVTQPTEARAWLTLDLEPGPSLGRDELALSVLNEANQVVAEVRLTRRERVTLELPLNSERVQIFRLRAESADLPAPNDGRLLNFRVIAFDWAAPPDA